MFCAILLHFAENVVVVVVVFWLREKKMNLKHLLVESTWVQSLWVRTRLSAKHLTTQQI